MHRKANSKSNARKEERCYSSILVNHSRCTLALGIVATLGLSALLPSPSVSALSGADGITIHLLQTENVPYSSYLHRIDNQAVSFGTMVVPVGIEANNISNLSIEISSVNDKTTLSRMDGNTETTDHINPLSLPSGSNGVSYNDFYSSDTYNNQWGYRAALTSLDAGNLGILDGTTDSTTLSLHTLANTTPLNSTYTTYGGFIENALGRHDSSDTTKLFSPLTSSTNKTLVAKVDDVNNYNEFNKTGYLHSYHGLLALEFAAKVDTTIPSGSYEREVLVSLVSNPHRVSSFIDPTTGKDILYMQEMTSTICSNATTPNTNALPSNGERIATWNVGTRSWSVEPNPDFAGDATRANAVSSGFVPETVLLDKRDNKPYLVRKLADGNCWMSSDLDYNNLDLTYDDAGTTKTGVAAMTAQLQNSDLTNLKGTWSSPTVNTTEKAVGTSWTDAYSDGLRTFSWSQYNSGMAFSKKTGHTFADSSTGEIYEYRGTLYNWYAATIGSYNASADNTNATSSICPKGWKLPDKQGTKSWQTLLSTYGFATSNQTSAEGLMDFPLDFPRTGAYLNGALNDQTDRGYWWTSTSKSGTYAYNLYTTASNVDPQSNRTRRNGLAVRCVAE